jgi:hypothetical protein
MKHRSTIKTTKNQKSDHLSDAIQPELPGLNLNKNEAYQNIEKELNSKILEITMTIKDHYPELSKYLDEMPATIPTEKDPKMTLNHLQTYYESLNSLLNKYKVDYPKIEE